MPRTLETSTRTSSQWEKVSHAMGLIRDVLFQVGHKSTSTSATQPPPPSQKHVNTNIISNNKGLLLIGAGMARTGTKSIEKALGILGFRVYDSRAIMEHKHESQWLQVTKAWKRDGNLQPMEELLQEVEALGYTATLDTPMNHLAEALLQLRSKAKVLWSHRNNNYSSTSSSPSSSPPEQVWYDSYCFIVEFALQWQYGRPWKWIFPQMSDWIIPIEQEILPFEVLSVDAIEFHTIFPWYDVLNRETLPIRTDPVLKQNYLNVYKDTPQKLKDAILLLEQSNHNRHSNGNTTTTTTTTTTDSSSSNNTISSISNSIIDERFLEFHVQQGWAPLMKFLDIQEQDQDQAALLANLVNEPFPHVNERSTLMAVDKTMHILGAGLPLIVIITVYLFYRFIIAKLLLYIMKLSSSSSSRHQSTKATTTTKSRATKHRSSQQEKRNIITKPKLS